MRARERGKESWEGDRKRERRRQFCGKEDDMKKRGRWFLDFFRDGESKGRERYILKERAEREMEKLDDVLWEGRIRRGWLGGGEEVGWKRGGWGGGRVVVVEEEKEEDGG
jgi:hypothetical protein